MQKIKLFCIPYAGGSAVIYSNWKSSLAPWIELRPVELAGRGRRIHDPLYNSIEEAAQDVFKSIESEAGNCPYVLFGHSMGCMIAYELARKIRAERFPPPLHLFFSGRRAPHVTAGKEKKLHLLNDQEFKEEILQLGGTPPEFFEHRELQELFLPLLRQDFKLTETHIFDGKLPPLDTDITVLAGKEDDLTPEECDGWKHHTSKICTIHYFNGGHFFFQKEVARITKIIGNTIQNLEIPIAV